MAKSLCVCNGEGTCVDCMMRAAIRDRLGTDGLRYFDEHYTQKVYPIIDLIEITKQQQK